MTYLASPMPNRGNPFPIRIHHPFCELGTRPLRAEHNPWTTSTGFELTLVSGLPDSKEVAISFSPNTQTVDLTAKLL